MNSKPKKQAGCRDDRNTRLGIFDNSSIKALSYAILIDILADFMIFLLALGFNYVQSPEGLQRWMRERKIFTESVTEKLEHLNDMQDSQRVSED